MAVPPALEPDLEPEGPAGIAGRRFGFPTVCPFPCIPSFISSIERLGYHAATANSSNRTSSWHALFGVTGGLSPMAQEEIRPFQSYSKFIEIQGLLRKWKGFGVDFGKLRG